MTWTTITSSNYIAILVFKSSIHEMVNKKVTTLTNSDSNNDEDDMAKMCTAMGDLRW